jgi:hypothetical protein
MIGVAVRPAARRAVAVLLLTGPLSAAALQIGEPAALPVLGQTLDLEIPLALASGEQTPANECVRLRARPDDDEGTFFLRDMRAAVATHGAQVVLRITTPQSVNVPAVGFRLSLDCAVGVAKDFMLLVSPREVLMPMSASTSAPSSAAPLAQSPPTARVGGASHELRLLRDTTLNRLAQRRYPSSRPARDEFRRLIAQLNPELFANIEHVGAVPLPAGTVLKMPAVLPGGGQSDVSEEPAKSAVSVTPAAPMAAGLRAESLLRAAAVEAVASPAGEVRGGGSGRSGSTRREDRLLIGASRIPALSRQDLGQALDRLEQMMGEKSRSDLAMSETLTSLAGSFAEVQVYLQGVDERVRRAETEQARAQAELQTLRIQTQSAFSLMQMFLAIIAGGVMGAGTIVLFQRMAGSRSPQPFGMISDAAAPVPERVVIPPRQDRSEPVVPVSMVTAGVAGDEGAHSDARSEPALAPATPDAVVVAPATPGVAVPVADVAVAPPPLPEPEVTCRVDGGHVELAIPEATFELEIPSAGRADVSAPMMAMAAVAPAPGALDLELELPLDTGKAAAGVNGLAGVSGIGGISGVSGVSGVSGQALVGADPVLELADVMASLGLAREAAQAIIEHIHQNPHQDPSHWFKVLEIYRKTGNREGFDVAVRELRQHLNVSVGGWAEAAQTERKSIEDYPHLSAELQALWHKPECDEFLNRLLEDNRGGQRAGFPQSVAEEIALLRHLRRNAALIDFPPIGVSQAGALDAVTLDERNSWRTLRGVP